MSVSCPDDSQLSAFVAGKLSSLALERLAEHLAACSTCQQRLESLDEQDDQVVHALRRPLVRDPLQEQQAIQRLLASPRPEQATTPLVAVMPAFRLPDEVGDYQILGEIGRGGMGVVYRAYDRRHQQTVALKTLQSMDPALLYRFKQEFRTLAGVTHPNLVSLHELVSDGQVWFFTMELIEGVDFFNHVRDDSPDRTKLRQALAQLARGLSALHEADKLHRDLKPANVLVSRQGRVVLLDFGLSAQLDRSGKHAGSVAMIVGTLPYMAPEQADAASLTPAADWYSFGVMLHEALTGQVPFSGSVNQVLRDKQQCEPPPPSTLAPDVPADLDRLCVDLLHLQPEERPSGRDVLQRLGALPSAPLSAPPAVRHGIFVGRQPELAALHDAFASLKRGKPILLHLRGRSGVGKSTLVQRFLDAVRLDEAVVLEGRCYEQESVPYKAFDSLIDGLSRYLARLPRGEADSLLPRDVSSLVHVFPVLRQAAALAQAPRREVSLDVRELRCRAFAGLRELLARLGDRRPLVLSIDDLQWGDTDSAALLAGLLLPPDPPVLLLVAAYRSEEMNTSPFLQEFLAAEARPLSGLERRQVGIEPLAEDEARELAHQLLKEENPVDAFPAGREEIIARESRGNPFFVQELVQYFRAAGLQTVAAALADSDLLDEVLWQRVQTLPEAARRLVEVVAVAGWPLRQDDAARAAELTPEDHAVPTALRANRLLRGTGKDEFIETYHDRVRETVLAHLEPWARARHHARLAEVLEAGARTEAEVLAFHWRGAGAEAKAGHYYALAAEKAQAALAFDRAADYLREALRLKKPGRAEEYQLRARLGEAFGNAGRGAESAQEYLKAAELTTGLDIVKMWGLASHKYLLSGHVDEGVTTLTRVVEAVGLRMPSGPGGAVWGIVWRHLWLRCRGLGFTERDPATIPLEVQARLDTCAVASRGLIQVMPISARYFQTCGLLEALRAGDLLRIAGFLILEVGHMSMAGGAPGRRARRLWAIIDELAGKVTDPRIRSARVLTRALESYLRGEWRAGLNQFEEAEQIVRQECVGEAWDLSFCQVFGLASLIYVGELGRLQQLWPAMMREAADRGDRHTALELGLLPMTMVRLAEDRPDEAQRAIAEAVAAFGQAGFMPAHYFALLSELWVAFYKGDAERALRLSGECETSEARTLTRLLQKARIDLLALRAGAELGQATRGVDVSANHRLARRCIGQIERERMAWSEGIALALRAALAVSCGERQEAETFLAGAGERFDATGMGLHAASVRRQLGLLRGDGRAIEEADAWMTQRKVRNPARMANVFAPGFAPCVSSSPASPS